MAGSQFKFDLKRLSEIKEQLPKEATDLLHKFRKDFSTQIIEYEKKVRGLVHNLDIKSREAKDLSRERLDGFASELKKRRADVEKKVGRLVNLEKKRLESRVTDLVVYMRKVAKIDTKVTTKKAKTKKKSTKPRARAPRKTAAKRVINVTNEGASAGLSPA